MIIGDIFAFKGCLEGSFGFEDHLFSLTKSFNVIGLTDVKCALCAEFEEVNHILSRLEMLFARFMWSCVRSLPDALGPFLHCYVFFLLQCYEHNSG